MIAFRTTWHIKPGMMEKALEHLTTGAENIIAELIEGGYTKVGEWRIYTKLYGPYELVFEQDFDEVSDNDDFWAEINRVFTADQLGWDEWYSMVERVGTTHVWNLTK